MSFAYLLRYELDLVIELNASTLRALEPILKRIAELSEEESSEFKLDTPMDGTAQTILNSTNYCPALASATYSQYRAYIWEQRSRCR